MSTIAVFYQSAASDPRTGLADGQGLYPEFREHAVRQLIHIVVRMLLISSHSYPQAGKSAATGIDCERPQNNASTKGPS
jgi:hypothetical protein